MSSFDHCWSSIFFGHYWPCTKIYRRDVFQSSGHDWNICAFISNYCFQILTTKQNLVYLNLQTFIWNKKKHWTIFEWNHCLIVMKELVSFDWALWCLQHSAHDLQAAILNQPPPSAFFRAKTTQCLVPLQCKALGRDWAQRDEGVPQILLHQRWAFQYFKEEINQLVVVRVYKGHCIQNNEMFFGKKARFLVWLPHRYTHRYGNSNSCNKDHW